MLDLLCLSVMKKDNGFLILPSYVILLLNSKVLWSIRLVPNIEVSMWPKKAQV